MSTWRWRLWGALLALCALAVGFVRWRPPSQGPLPAPVERKPRARPSVANTARSPVAAPEDEPAAEDPAPAIVTTDMPEQLTRRDLEATLSRVEPKVQGCAEIEQFTGQLTAQLTIARTGQVQAVTVLPPVAETRTAECVVRALRGVTFPRFRGTLLPTIEWTYPFQLQPR